MPVDDAEGPEPDFELSQPVYAAPPDAAPVPVDLAESADMTIKSIIGTDTRRAVNDPTAAPWSGIGRLSVSGAMGVSHGTAFMISERWAMTAAHVIFKAGASPRPRLRLADGRLLSAHYIPHPDYRRTRARADDVALLRLDQDAPGFRFLSDAFSDDELQVLVETKAEARAAGYPLDGAGKLMWGAGPLVSHTPQLIEHQVDTNKAQSGAPLFRVTPDKIRLLGVHAHGDITTHAAEGVPNVAVRFTPWVRDWALAAIAQRSA